MIYAIVRKADDRVEYVRTSTDPNLNTTMFYEVATTHSFSPPAHEVWWKHSEGVFTNEGARTTPEQDNVKKHLAEYASALLSAGFTGDPQDIESVETWFFEAIDSVTDLDGLKILMKYIVKASGRAQAASVYGWRIFAD